MGEYVIQAVVRYEIDTNKGTTRKTLRPYEHESWYDFAQRVAEHLQDALDARSDGGR